MMNKDYFPKSPVAGGGPTVVGALAVSDVVGDGLAIGGFSLGDSSLGGERLAVFLFSFRCF